MKWFGIKLRKNVYALIQKFKIKENVNVLVICMTMEREIVLHVQIHHSGMKRVNNVKNVIKI